MPRKKATGKKSPKRRPKPKPVAEHTLERGAKHFGEEVQRLGEKMERRGDEWDSWFHTTFGFVGPLISSVFGLLILAVAAWALMFVNVPLGSTFLTNMQAFLMVNIGLFFLVFLFFSYSTYFSKVSPRAYRPFSPIVTAAGIAIGLWIALQVVRIANFSLLNTTLSVIAFWLERSIFFVFLLALIVGYLVLLVRIGTEKPISKAAKARLPVIESKRPKTRGGVVHRLYRSGNDRILGGVCGGIAEYLTVDPTIIRLLWIVLTLMAWGSGIILYIILWIIIPRNPDHKWD